MNDESRVVFVLNDRRNRVRLKPIALHTCTSKFLSLYWIARLSAVGGNLLVYSSKHSVRLPFSSVS
jgi:hypothetical protein